MSDQAIDPEICELKRQLAELKHAAKELNDFLGANVGTTDDWPISITTDSDDSVNQLCALMNRLQELVK